MRRAARIDNNQVEVVKALRSAGITVVVTSAVGKGFVDLVCGFRGYTFLLEVKDGAKFPSEQVLTKEEREFHDTWAGHIAVVNSPEAAVTEIVRAWKAVTEREAVTA